MRITTQPLLKAAFLLAFLASAHGARAAETPLLGMPRGALCTAILENSRAAIDQADGTLRQNTERTIETFRSLQQRLDPRAELSLDERGVHASHAEVAARMAGLVEVYDQQRNNESDALANPAVMDYRGVEISGAREVEAYLGTQWESAQAYAKRVKTPYTHIAVETRDLLAKLSLSGAAAFLAAAVVRSNALANLDPTNRVSLIGALVTPIAISVYFSLKTYLTHSVVEAGEIQDARDQALRPAPGRPPARSYVYESYNFQVPLRDFEDLLAGDALDPEALRRVRNAQLPNGRTQRAAINEPIAHVFVDQLLQTDLDGTPRISVMVRSVKEPRWTPPTSGRRRLKDWLDGWLQVLQPIFTPG